MKKKMDDNLAVTVMMVSLTTAIVRSKYQVDVPKISFEPQVLPKRQKDISSIDDKIIALYARNDHLSE